MDRETTDTSNLDAQLFLAARDGDTRTVADLLARGATPNLREVSSGTTPLLLAVCHGDAGLVKLLLAHGADTDTSYYARATPLHTAAYLGHEAVVLALLAAGAAPKSRNKRGFTPLHDASGEGHTGIARILLDGGADIDAIAGPQKETPLHMAAYHGRYEAARVLVGGGALLHPKTLDGITPLLLAASRQHLPIVRLLLDSRRAIGIPDGTGAADSAAARELCRRAADLRLQWQDESNLVKAEALFREAIQEFPEHWEGHYGLGELLHLRANWARAKSGAIIDKMIREIRQAAELAPDHIEPVLKFARVVAELDVESAEPLYRRAMDTTIPGKPTRYEEGCQANDHWAIATEAAGRSGCEALCLEAFCRAIDFDPEYYGGVVMPDSERAQDFWSVALLVKPGGPPKPP